MSRTVIFANVPNDQVDRVTEDAEHEHGVVSAHDNGDGTTTLTVVFPTEENAGSAKAVKVLGKMVSAGLKVNFTNF